MKPELESVLVDVRRAYRLLAIYQRRLLDLATNASALLGFEFGSWEPATHRPAATQNDPSDRWVWDLVPAHRAKFNYQPRSTPAVFEWMLTVEHDPDTGFRTAGTKEPDPLLFEPVTASRSLVKLHAFVITGGTAAEPNGGNAAQWYSVWDAAKHAPDDDRPWTGRAGNFDVLAIRRSHSFAALSDEAELRQALLSLQLAVLQLVPNAKQYLNA